MSLNRFIYLLKKYNLIFFLLQSLIFKNHKYLGKYGIISAGGVATTNLIKFLSKFVKLNDKDNLDGLKHLKYLPNKKKFYIFIV